MAHIEGRSYSREELLSVTGHPEQVAFARLSKLEEGKAAGLRAVEVETGGGLRLTVLPGRGMDIAHAFYRGTPLAFISPTGITSPAYYEEPGLGWLRSFFGGLLTTCGITNAGAPSEDQGKPFGLHGRVSNAEAENLCIHQGWAADEYIIRVEGTVREAEAMGENLTLTRTIETSLGRAGFTLTDTVSNNGFEEQPLMMLYHCNFGWPLLSGEAQLIAPVTSTVPRNQHAAADDGVATALQYHEPVTGYEEKVYFHELSAGEDGSTFVALVNPRCHALRDRGGFPLGVVLRFDRQALPRFTQWKMLRKGFYVTGLEPGTVIPEGRGPLRRRGELPMIGPLEEYQITVDFDVVDTQDQIDRLQQEAIELADGRTAD